MTPEQELKAISKFTPAEKLDLLADSVLPALARAQAACRRLGDEQGVQFYQEQIDSFDQIRVALIQDVL